MGRFWTSEVENEEEFCINEGSKGRALALKLLDESFYSQGL